MHQYVRIGTQHLFSAVEVPDAPKPLYKHDCSKCYYLGQYYGEKDLYVCGGSVIARYGDLGYQYDSCPAEHAHNSAPLQAAVDRAVQEGFRSIDPSYASGNRQHHIERMLKLRLEKFVKITDYERAQSFFSVHVKEFLNQIRDASLRYDLRFEFMEHLHDLSVMHNAGLA